MKLTWLSECSIILKYKDKMCNIKFTDTFTRAVLPYNICSMKRAQGKWWTVPINYPVNLSWTWKTNKKTYSLSNIFIWVKINYILRTTKKRLHQKKSYTQNKGNLTIDALWATGNPKEGQASGHVFVCVHPICACFYLILTQWPG